jgi:hypothetical protein
LSHVNRQDGPGPPIRPGFFPQDAQGILERRLLPETLGSHLGVAGGSPIVAARLRRRPNVRCQTVTRPHLSTFGFETRTDNVRAESLIDALDWRDHRAATGS